jgi:hypothetical protein
MLSWDRKKIISDSWEFEQVEDFSLFSGFECGDDDLDDFIRNDAKTHKRELIAETYAYRFIDEEGLKTAPLAFVSLSNDLVRLSKKQKKVIHWTLRGYEHYPAVKVARLGVHRDLQGKNIGTELLNLVKLLFLSNNRTGCRFVTVNAINKQRVLSFYSNNDFSFLDEEQGTADKTRFMFYDLKRFVMNH